MSNEAVKPGERVIMEGTQKARRGTQVNPTTVATGVAGSDTEKKAQGKPAEAKPAGKGEGK